LIAHRQAAAYKNIKLNLADNTLMIELDWKQKVLIGNKNIIVLKNHLNAQWCK